MVMNAAGRLRLGDMLVAAQLITQEQLEKALQVQQGSPALPLGKLLVQLGFVTEVQVTQTLSNQLSIPWVSIAYIEFSASLLQRMPGEVADRFSVMPIYVRSVRGQGDTLYVAMDDPTDEDALVAVSNASGLPVRPMVAPPSDIRTAIERHYFGAPDPSLPPPPPGSTPLQAPARPGGSQPPQRASATDNGGQAAPASGERSPTGTRKKPPPPEPGGPSRTPDEIPLEIYLKPSTPPDKPPAEDGRTLTLLDGTRLALPGAVKSKAGSEIREVRHLMKSIRAAQRAGAAGGPPRWDEVVQVLLELLAQRGASITRREFAEAWLQRRGTHGSEEEKGSDSDEPS